MHTDNRFARLVPVSDGAARENEMNQRVEWQVIRRRHWDTWVGHAYIPIPRRMPDFSAAIGRARLA